MANTLTGLFPQIFASANRVARSQIGLIPSVTRDINAQAVAKGESLKIPVVGKMTSSDIVPNNVSSTGSDRSVEVVDLVISKSKKCSFNITGEEELALKPDNQTSIFQQSLEAAFQQLSGEIETDLANLYVGASLAYGAAGTTPLATADDLTDLSQVRALLNINGAPMDGRSVVLNDAASSNLRGKQPSVFRVNEDGTPMGRRMGATGMLFNFDISESSYMARHSVTGSVAGTFAINKTAGYLKGDVDLRVDGTANGDSVKAGDTISIQNDTTKYVVREDADDGFSTLKIARPGLRKAAANNAEITVGNAYAANFALQKSAILLGMRPPALPVGGDSASDSMEVVDEKSMLTYRISLYKQYQQNSVEVQAAWGVKILRPEYLVLLMG